MAETALQLQAHYIIGEKEIVMGTLVRMGMLAGLGGLAYKFFQKKSVASGSNADAAPVHSSGIVRNAGPDEQISATKYNWDKVDEQSDESFPASDPPAIN